MRPRKRVLLVSYYFPPAGGPGSLRLLSFARHLPRNGWDPVVLTVRSSESPQRDESLLESVPETVPVHRTFALEPHAVYRALTGRSRTPLPAGVLSSPPSGRLDALLRWTRRNLYVPDARIGWIPFCAAAARALVERERIDCVLTSSPPHSVHLAGRLVRSWTGVPWVADLRDPWTGIEYYAGGERTRLARALDERLERGVLRTADRVVTTSEDLAETLARAHGEGVARKTVVIRNGVDPEEFAASDGAPRDDRFRVTHVGQLPASRSPRTYIAALRAALQARESMRDRLEIRFVGPVDPSVRRDVDAAGLLPYCRFEGFLPHREALAAMRDSAALLAPLREAAERPDIVPAKLFEYMAVRRPILVAAAGGSEVARLVESWAGVAPVAPGDVDGARDHLLQIDAAFVDGRIADLPPFPSFLDRRELVARLAATLAAACGDDGDATTTTTVGRNGRRQGPS